MTALHSEPWTPATAILPGLVGEGSPERTLDPRPLRPLERPHQAIRLLCGAGLRLLECCRLRVKDLEFTRSELIARDGKRGIDRVALLPASLYPQLQPHLARRAELHERDLHQGIGGVDLPLVRARKSPRAGIEWGWPWVFPATRHYLGPETGTRRRHHLHETVLQRVVSEAARRARSPQPVSCRALRRAFATHLTEGRLGHPHHLGTPRPVALARR